MTNKRQLDLFADYNPESLCQAHSPTSRAAAEEIEPKAETLRRAVPSSTVSDPSGNSLQPLSFLTDRQLLRSWLIY
jgi:hypothetical protein